jgi:hypothetical protein
MIDIKKPRKLSEEQKTAAAERMKKYQRDKKVSDV